MDLEQHKVFICEESRVATFPLYNITGQMPGTLEYRPDNDKTFNNGVRSRYFTIAPKGSPVVWGMESWSNSEILFICEGVFDAARLTNLGYSAVATLTNNPKHLYNWLQTIQRKRVAICDAGVPGQKLAKYGHYHYTMKDDDLGDASDDEVNMILDMFV